MPDPFIFKTYDEKVELEEEMGHTEPGTQVNPKGPEGTALLTITSKMFCFSFGLPYEQCCPGNEASMAKKLGICKLCYAAGGNYQYPSVKTAMGRRRELTRDPEQFTEMMLDALRDPWKYVSFKKGQTPEDQAFRQNLAKNISYKFFRIHDSGDFWGPEYVDAWRRICEIRDDITFWAPTRAWAAPGSWQSPVEMEEQVYHKTYTIAQMRRALTKLARIKTKNVILRPSMLEFDHYPEPNRYTAAIPGMAAPTGAIVLEDAGPGTKAEVRRTIMRKRVAHEVSEDGNWWRDAWICPAYKALEPRFNCHSAVGPDGKSPCRACWTKKNLRIVYPAH